MDRAVALAVEIQPSGSGDLCGGVDRGRAHDRHRLDSPFKPQIIFLTERH